MPLSFIKSIRDSKLWKKAIELTKERKAQRDPANPNYDKTLKPIENVFAYANYLFHHVLKGGGGMALAEGAEEQYIINSEEEQTLWEEIEKHVFSDASPYKDLQEESKWEKVESIFKEYCSSCQENRIEKLNEFLSTYNVSGSAVNNPAGLYGMGGYRDERPIGPIVYGMPNNSMEPMITSGEPINVEIPLKKEPYNPKNAILNASGDKIQDVIQSQKVSKLEQQPEPSEDDTDTVLGMLFDAGYTPEQLNGMDAEELEDAIVRLYKKQQAASAPKLQEGLTLKQKLLESFVYDDTADNQDPEALEEAKKVSSIKKARELLSTKLRVKNASKKDGRKYIVSSDEIDKIIRSYGYKWDSKRNIWVKKLSPTYMARKLLSDKFQDSSVLQKDQKNQYIIDQDEVRKRMRNKGYSWNSVKKEWEHISKKPEYKLPTPIPAAKPTSDNTPPQVSTAIQPPENDDDTPASSYEDDTETPWEKPSEKEEDLNPLHNIDTKSKMKEMAARFTLAIMLSNPQYTQFNKNSESKDYTPVISSQEVLEKIQTLGYEWDFAYLVWKNDANQIPHAIIDKGENEKTISARSYLAAKNRFVNIKINASGIPSVKPDTLEEKMENEDFIWIDQMKLWKWVGEDSDEEIKETVVLSEAITQNEEKFDKIQRKYSIVDVGEAQAKMLYRALQLEYFRKTYGSKPANIRDPIWQTIQDGSDNDPINGKLQISVVENNLNKLGFKFNEDEEKPMWVDKSGKLPAILTQYVSSPQEYIARGILSEKDKKYISITSQNGLNPDNMVPTNKVMTKIKEQDYTWHNDYGYIKGSKSNVLSKQELAVQEWLDDRKDIPFDDLSKQEQKLYKEYSVYRQAAKMSGISPKDWFKLSPDEKKNALNKYYRYYEFDNTKNEWKRRDTPLVNGTSKKINNALKNLMGKGIGFAFSKLGKAAKNIGSELAKSGQYN